MEQSHKQMGFNPKNKIVFDYDEEMYYCSNYQAQ